MLIVPVRTVNHSEQACMADHSVGLDEPIHSFHRLLVTERIQVVDAQLPNVVVLVLEPEQSVPVEVKRHCVLVKG